MPKIANTDKYWLAYTSHVVEDMPHMMCKFSFLRSRRPPKHDLFTPLADRAM